MKYIDADLLRKEIEFAKSVYSNQGRVVLGVADAYRQDGRAAMCDDILKKIDSLQQEQKEQPTRGYDEAYLNDCIAKAKKSWEGVDVDKYMDMVRGREQQEQPEVDLEKEIEEHSERMPMSEFTHDSEAEEFVKWAKQEFRHFYELGKNSK